MGITDAANIITGAKLQSNPENTIGFLTMGGSHCIVHEALNGDVDRMLASLSRVKTEGSLHLVEGLRIGSLALAHRANTKGEKRLIAFVASPITVPQETLTKLAKKLRKDEIAIDIVSIGGEENVGLLTAFIDAVNKNGNSHFVHIPAPCSIPDMVVTSAVLGGGGGGGNFEFGVDPSMDPELAMVLRMSAEEERRRQEQVSGGGTTTAPAAPPAQVQPQIPSSVDEDLMLALQLSREEEARRQEQEAKPTTTAPAPAPAGLEQRSNTQLSEEEQMKLALKMSVEQEDTDAVFDDIVNNEKFLADAAKAAGVDPTKVVPKKPEDKDQK
jgi:26S proteasome regulatory subunit N10